MILLALGVGVGVLAGLFGVGGGFMIVPALAALGWGALSATGTSLAVVTAMGFGGLAVQWRRGGFHALRGALGLGLAAAAGAPLGALAATHAAPRWLHGAFALLALAAMLLTLLPPAPAREGGGGVHPALAPLLGFGVGVVSGLLGVGGGVLLVPGQVHLLRRGHHEAVETSLAALALAGLSGSVTHLALGHVDPAAAGLLALGGFVGLRFGREGLRRLPVRAARLGFAALALAVAASAAYRAIAG